MSKVTTTTPATVVCSGESTTTITVTVVPTPVRLTTASGQHDVVLLSPLILRDAVRGVVSLATVPQQEPQSQMPSQAYASYAMGPSQVNSFSELILTPISLC